MTLLLAMLLDAVLGEPGWLWSRLTHPAVLMGRAVDALDTRLNTGTAKHLRGVVAILILVVAAGLLGWLLSLIGPVVEVVAAAILIAQKSLVDHVRAVADGLRKGLPDGRAAVSMIVSRDTQSMDTSAVARSAIESAAENLSDGVIAPIFWFAVGGLPGMLIYKIVNTADSMVGYRTERHAAYGWAAARLDDILNVIPARLTALLIALPYGQAHKWRDIWADARLHRSPNAGWPEAAMARVLGVALAGPRIYDGTPCDFPWVNPKGRRPLMAQDVDSACRTLWAAWALVFAGLLIIALL